MSRSSSFFSFRRLRPFAALSLLAAGALLPGCFDVGDDDDDDDDAESCRDDDDCRANQFCNSDDECERIDDDPDPEPECEDHDDCPSGELCNADGECESECALLCDFFSRCSTNPTATCMDSCTTVLNAPPPCGTAFELYIECVADYDAVCSTAATNCQDEAEIFPVACESAGS